MSSKRNHAIRSRKTHRYNLYGARRFLRGSMPFIQRKAIINMLKGVTDDESEVILNELSPATETPSEEAAA